MIIKIDKDTTLTIHIQDVLVMPNEVRHHVYRIIVSGNDVASNVIESALKQVADKLAKDENRKHVISDLKQVDSIYIATGMSVNSDDVLTVDSSHSTPELSC